MNQLTVNGIDFSGELPGEWTVSELVRVLETEVLFGDEIIVDVTVDGSPFGFVPGEAGPSLEAVDHVIVSSRRVNEIVLGAIESADETLDRFGASVAEAVDALRAGLEEAGVVAQSEAMETLAHFVDLCERLGTTLCGGLGPGPRTGDQVSRLAQDIGARLSILEAAQSADDLVEMCDAMEDLRDWLRLAWDAIWGEDHRN